jgi:hypothetical protein
VEYRVNTNSKRVELADPYLDSRLERLLWELDGDGKDICYAVLTSRVQLKQSAFLTLNVAAAVGAIVFCFGDAIGRP